MITRRILANSVLSAGILTAALLVAQSSADNRAEFTATTANVAGAPDEVRFEILRWSTNEEREKLLAAWNLEPPAGGRGAGKGAAKGGAKGGAPGAGGAKGGAKGGDKGAAAAKGKGGGGRGGGAAAAAPQTPDAALAAALQEAPTVGYLWSSEVAGYSLRYAGKAANADGTQRIVLITQRRLGDSNQRWNLTNGTPNKHEFSVIELRLNAKGEGEGRATLTGEVAPDSALNIVSSTNYNALPVVFRNVRPAKP